MKKYREWRMTLPTIYSGPSFEIFNSWLSLFHLWPHSSLSPPRHLDCFEANSSYHIITWIIISLCMSKRGEGLLKKNPHNYIFIFIFKNQFLNSIILQGSCFLMLSHFSHVQLFVTPQTVPSQAPRPWVFQTRVLEWVSLSSSRGSPHTKDSSLSLASPALAASSSPWVPPGKPSRSHKCLFTRSLFESRSQ